MVIVTANLTLIMFYGFESCLFIVVIIIVICEVNKQSMLLKVIATFRRGILKINYIGSKNKQTSFITDTVHTRT